MRISPPRVEAEAPFRTPEQLALAMPLIAIVGLMLVVAAVATGGSGRMVALVALAGFGLCALAPMALIEFYVTRPLRSALTQMRAARDGHENGDAAPSGVIGDLMQLARDIRAAQANFGPDVLARCEQMIAAGDDAVRALRLQSEELAEAVAGLDRPRAGAEDVDLADLADAVKGLRAVPTTGLDGAVERLEAMLVYIAESLERVETKDRQIEGGVGQVEQRVADLARLVTREAESVQGALSNGGLTARTDVASLVAEEMAARARVLERIDTLEARLVARLAETPSPDAREIALAIHSEAEANRSALREDAASGRLEAVAAELSRAAAEFSQGLAQPVVDPVGAELRAELQGLSANVVRLIEDRVLAGQGGDAALAALGERLREETEAHSRRLDEIESHVVDRFVAIERENQAVTLTALMRATQQVANAASRVDEIAARPVADIAGIASAVEALAASPPPSLDVEPVRAVLGEAEMRLTVALAAVAARIEASTSAQGEKLEAFETQALTPARQALESATQDFLAARARLEEAAAKVEAGDPRFDRVTQASEAAQVRLAELAVHAQTQAETIGARLDAATLAPAREALAGAAVRFEVAQTQLADFLSRNDASALAAQFDAAALDPAREALSQAAADFANAQTRLVDAAAQIEAGAPALAAAPGEIRALLNETLRTHAHDLAAITPARVTLAEAAARFDAAQARLVDAAAQIEAGANAPEEIRALLNETLRVHSHDLAALAPARVALAQAAAQFSEAAAQMEALAAAPAEIRAVLDASLGAHADDLAALAPARVALAQAATQFSEAAAQMEALAAAPGVLETRLAAFGERLDYHADDLAALAPAREALKEATQRFEAAEARLCDAATQIEAGDPRLAALSLALPEVARELVSAVEAGAQKQSESVETHGRALDALRAEFAAAAETVSDAVAAFAARFDVEAQRLAEALEKQGRDDHGAPLAELSQAMRDLQAAFAQSPEAAASGAALDALRADFLATSAAAAAKFDEAAQALTRSVEDSVESLRRGELGPAIFAAQTTAQDLHTAHASLFGQIEALKAALVTDRSGFAALRLDVVEAFATVAAIGERADASMREAAARADALAASVIELGAAERAELGVVSRTLATTGERIDNAARAFEDRRGDLDLPALAADLTRDIDALGRTTAERLLSLEGGVSTLSSQADETLGALRGAAQGLDVAGIARKLDGLREAQEAGLRALALQPGPIDLGGLTETLQTAAATLDAAIQSVREMAGADPAPMREDLAGLGHSALQAPEALDVLRGELGAVGETVRTSLDGFAASLAALERRWGPEPKEVGARSRGAATEARSSGAVARLVVSMADALDFRFSHIEAALADLAVQVSTSQVGPDSADINSGMKILSDELHSASEALKSGLSDFVGMSATLAEEVARLNNDDALESSEIAASAR